MSRKEYLSKSGEEFAKKMSKLQTEIPRKRKECADIRRGIERVLKSDS